MSLQSDEQDLKRRLIEEVPQEPITADPPEDDEDEDVPEGDDEHGGQTRAAPGETTASGEIVRRARPGSR